MDPHETLREARLAASEGRYADALRAHVWFHDHALEHEPGLQGVRLSFALGDWVDLGRVYPEALRTLQHIRDSKAAELIAGPRSQDRFADVASIDHALGDDHHTYELFRRILEIDEDFARSCARLAMDAIVGAKHFALAERFLPDPQEEIASASDDLNEDVRRHRDPGRSTRHPDRLLKADAHVYADRVARILTVLHGVGRTDEARRVRAFAIDSVADESVRATVRELLPPCGDAE